MTPEVQHAILPPSGILPAGGEELAKKLEQFRRERYDTVREFADLLGMTPKTYFRIIQGKVHPRLSTIKKAAKALGVQPSEIEEFKLPEGEEGGVS